MIPGTPSRMRHPDLHAVLADATAPAALQRPDLRHGRLRRHGALLASLQSGNRHG